MIFSHASGKLEAIIPIFLFRSNTLKVNSRNYFLSFPHLFVGETSHQNIATNFGRNNMLFI